MVLLEDRATVPGGSVLEEVNCRLRTAVFWAGITGTLRAAAEKFTRPGSKFRTYVSESSTIFAFGWLARTD